MPEVKIILDKSNWKMHLEGFGFKGRQCVKELDKIQRLLGGATKKRIPKDDRIVKERLKI